MIIVTDPWNMSTREVIKVSRELTERERVPLTTSTARDGFDETAQAGQTHADRANVHKIDKPNVQIVELKDEKGDIVDGTEPQIDDVAKIERDKDFEAKTDAVAENRNGEVLQECDSKTNMERSAEAPQQQQQQSQ